MDSFIQRGEQDGSQVPLRLRVGGAALHGFIELSDRVGGALSNAAKKLTELFDVMAKGMMVNPDDLPTPARVAAVGADATAPSPEQ